MKTIQKITLLTAGLLASVASWAEGTAAGSTVSNTATATYYAPSDTTQVSVTSTATFTVQELIDVSITAASGTDVVTDQQDVVTAYTISNDGNGSEVFSVSLANTTGDDFDVTGITMYFDGDGDGVFTSADLAYPVAIGDSLNLAADATTTIFVVVDIPTQDVGDYSDLVMTVTSQTPGAAGAAQGTILAGEGDNGVDAVVGIDTTNPANIFTHTYTVVVDPNAPATAVTVTKSVLQHADQFGTNKAIPGATTTYQILVVVNSAVDSLVVADTMPAQVTYVAGSARIANSNQAGTDISSTGTVLNDSTVYGTQIDANGRITVDLGNQTTTGAYTIQFDATIN